MDRHILSKAGPSVFPYVADSKLTAAATSPQLWLSLQMASQRSRSLVVEAHEDVGLVGDGELGAYEQVQQRSVAVSHPMHRQLLLDEEALPRLAQLLHALLKCLQAGGEYCGLHIGTQQRSTSVKFVEASSQARAHIGD